MEITDILRAQEWLPSVPLHVQLYRAFGWEPPRFCHLPMVLGKDGQKLSKRHGATSVREFRRQGYLPEALVNYLALVGWSYDDARELFSLADLERLFDDREAQQGAGRLRLPEAGLVQRHVPAERRPGPSSRRSSARCSTRPAFPATGWAMRDSWRAWRDSIQERVKLLSEVPDMVRYLFDGPAAYAADDLVPKKLGPDAHRGDAREPGTLHPSRCDGDPGDRGKGSGRSRKRRA